MHNMEQLFFNDVAIYLSQDPQLITDHLPYFKPLTQDCLISQLPGQPNQVFIQTHEQGFRHLFQAFDQLFPRKPQSITIWLKKKMDYNQLMQPDFKIIHAAGGVVSKGHQILMIYRLNKWDLPKGKLELGEAPHLAAVREVAEECGVEAIPVKKLGSTWHNYTQDGIPILKQTTWYAMDCVQDAAMQPQEAEDITQVAWIDLDRLESVLKDTYTSIAHVLQTYLARLAS